MDISSVARNVAVIEAGAWVRNIPGMGDLALQVRGKDNSDWRRVESKEIADAGSDKRINGRLIPEEIDRITAVLLRDAGLTGWENFTDGGAAVPFSKEVAYRYMIDPQYRGFLSAALWAAERVSETRANAAADVAKN